MPFSLLRYGLKSKHEPWSIIPPTPELKTSYDVVIVGAGGHGLAAAYYLATQHGIRNIAVLEKGYLGGGNTARNTAIIRANYLTPEGVKFYTRLKTVTQRWPTGIRSGADFHIPTMG